MGTFVAVAAICLYLWSQNKKGIALLLFVIVFMQLLEYFLWINPTCNDTNKLVSAIIPIYLYLQPAAIAFAIWATNSGYGGFYPHIIIASLMGLIPYQATVKPRKPCITAGESSHLDWNILDNIFTAKLEPYQYASYILYYGAMLYVVATLKNTRLAAIMSALFIGSWFVAHAKYTDVWGSVWCHAVNAGAVAAVFA